MTDADGPGSPTLTARVEAGGEREETDVSIEVVRQCSSAAPPVVAITVENVWTRTRTFHFEYTAPFTPLVGRGPDGTERLHLVPLGDQVPDAEDGWPGESVWSHLVPDAPEDGCWRVTGTYSRNRWEGGTVWSAAPGGSTTREYAVLDTRDAPECFPSGTYRFDAEWCEETPEGDLAERSMAFAVEVDR